MKTIIIVILMSGVGCSQGNVRPKASAASHKKQECEPPDPKDPNGEINNNLSVNGVSYVCSKDGEWVIDKETMQWKAKMAAHRHELYWALRTRVLTSAEMDEVKQYDIYLLVEEMVPYREADKQKEFNAALLQQFRLRMTQERKQQ